MALDLCQNFVSLNILRTNLQNITKFYKCIYIDKIYVGIATGCFLHIVPELWPLIFSKILFPLNILRTNWQNFTKKNLYAFIFNAFIFTISSLGLLLVIFRKFVPELCMALDLRQNLISSQYLENKLAEFHHILYMQSYWQYLVCNRDMTLVDVRICFCWISLDFPAKYLLNKKLGFFLCEKGCSQAIVSLVWDSQVHRQSDKDLKHQYLECILLTLKELTAAKCSDSVGRAFNWGSKGLSITSSRVTVFCPWARHFIRCLALVKPRKSSPDMTEKLLTGT